MDGVLAFLFSHVEVLGQNVSVLALIAGVLLGLGIIRQAWQSVGVLALVAIFAYWVPLMKEWG